MSDDRTNENEGSDPSADIAEQNRDGKGGPGTGESRAGAGEGPDAGAATSSADKGGPGDRAA